MNLGIIIHYLHWPTSTRYACGADAVGRRSTRRDGNSFNTTCTGCLKSPLYPKREEAAAAADR